MKTTKKLTKAQIKTEKEKRNEQSRICKRAKRAAELGMTLDEYNATLQPLSKEELRLRRNEQSLNSKARKKLKTDKRVRALVNLSKGNPALVEKYNLHRFLAVA
jgi:hypothetical protein